MRGGELPWGRAAGTELRDEEAVLPEDLDAVIVGVGNDDVAGPVDRDPARRDELAVARAPCAEAAARRPIGPEARNRVAVTVDAVHGSTRCDGYVGEVLERTARSDRSHRCPGRCVDVDLVAA